MINCIRLNDKTGKLSKLIIDFGINEASALGLKEAIKV